MLSPHARDGNFTPGSTLPSSGDQMNKSAALPEEDRDFRLIVGRLAKRFETRGVVPHQVLGLFTKRGNLASDDVMKLVATMPLGLSRAEWQQIVLRLDINRTGQINGLSKNIF